MENHFFFVRKQWVIHSFHYYVTSAVFINTPNLNLVENAVTLKINFCAIELNIALHVRIKDDNYHTAVLDIRAWFDFYVIKMLCLKVKWLNLNRLIFNSLRLDTYHKYRSSRILIDYLYLEENLDQHLPQSQEQQSLVHHCLLLPR